MRKIDTKICYRDVRAIMDLEASALLGSERERDKEAFPLYRGCVVPAAKDTPQNSSSDYRL